MFNSLDKTYDMDFYVKKKEKLAKKNLLREEMSYKFDLARGGSVTNKLKQNGPQKNIQKGKFDQKSGILSFSKSVIKQING